MQNTLINLDVSSLFDIKDYENEVNNNMILLDKIYIN